MNGYAQRRKNIPIWPKVLRSLADKGVCSQDGCSQAPMDGFMASFDRKRPEGLKQHLQINQHGWTRLAGHNEQ